LLLIFEATIWVALLTSIGQPVALAALAPRAQAPFLTPLAAFLTQLVIAPQPHSLLLNGIALIAPSKKPWALLIHDPYFLVAGFCLAQAAILATTL